MTSLEINKLLPIQTSNVQMKFGVDNQSQTEASRSGNQKYQYGRQAAILKVTSLKTNRLLPIVTSNMYRQFQIEIPKQTWVTLRKPCRLQTDGQDKSSIRPTNCAGRGIKTFCAWLMGIFWTWPQWNFAHLATVMLAFPANVSLRFNHSNLIDYWLIVGICYGSTSLIFHYAPAWLLQSNAHHGNCTSGMSGC